MPTYSVGNLNVHAVTRAEVGAAGGVPSLNTSGKVPATQLPLAGLRITFLYNGTNYIGPDGVAATSSNSSAAARSAAGYGGTFRDYVSSTGPDPNALGLMIDGDAWDATP